MRASFREGANRSRLGHKKTHCGRILSKEVADNIANWEITCNDRCHREADYTSAENQTFTTTLGGVEPEVIALREEYHPSLARKLSEDEEEEETAIKEEYNRPHQRSSIQHSSAELPTSCILGDPAVQAAFEACIFQNANYWAMQFWDSYSLYLRPNSGRIAEDTDLLDRLVMEDNLQKQDDEFMKRNQVNNLLDEMEESCAASVERLLKDYQEDDVLTSQTVSLMMDNHSLKHGAFREYRRPLVANAFDFRVKKLHSGATPPQMEAQYTYCVTEEQKRQAPHMYFEPLEVLLARDQLEERNEYRIKDGTTFDIRGNIDEVKFQRTGSGSLFLETEVGEYKKYYEYKRQSPCDDLLKLPNSGKSSQSEFRVKYAVSQNDKACQTEEDLFTSASSKLPCQRYQRCLFPPTFDIYSAREPYKVIQHHGGVGNPGIMDRAIENMGDVDESTSLGYAPKSSNVLCKHCNAEYSWPWRKDIWAGNELCGLCLWNNKAPTLIAEALIEVLEGVERLLSHLIHQSNSTGPQIF